MSDIADVTVPTPDARPEAGMSTTPAAPARESLADRLREAGGRAAAALLAAHDAGVPF